MQKLWTRHNGWLLDYPCILCIISMKTHTDVHTWFNYGSMSSLVSSRQTFLHRVLIEPSEKPHFEFTNQGMHHLFAVYSTVTQITKLVILVSIHNAACFLKLVHNTGSYTHSYPHTKNLNMNKHIALTHVTKPWFMQHT